MDRKGEEPLGGGGNLSEPLKRVTSSFNSRRGSLAKGDSPQGSTRCGAGGKRRTALGTVPGVGGCPPRRLTLPAKPRTSVGHSQFPSESWFAAALAIALPRR